ncbi:hypothetical protein Tco_1570711 [Tanacetum coccineum]
MMVKRFKKVSLYLPEYAFSSGKAEVLLSGGNSMFKKDVDSSIKSKDGIAFSKVDGNIEFHDICFAYPSRITMVYEGVVVGPSGFNMSFAVVAAQAANMSPPTTGSLMIHKRLRFLFGKLVIKSADTTKKGNNMLSLNLLYTNVVPAKWSNNNVTKHEPHSIIYVLDYIILSDPKLVASGIPAIPDQTRFQTLKIRCEPVQINPQAPSRTKVPRKERFKPVTFIQHHPQLQFDFQGLAMYYGYYPGRDRFGNWKQNCSKVTECKEKDIIVTTNAAKHLMWFTNSRAGKDKYPIQGVELPMDLSRCCSIGSLGLHFVDGDTSTSDIIIALNDKHVPLAQGTLRYAMNTPLKVPRRNLLSIDQQRQPGKIMVLLPRIQRLYEVQLFGTRNHKNNTLKMGSCDI